MISPDIKPPARFARLPIDDRGYHVPRFATWIDGKPDFRLADMQWVRQAITKRRCFLCGEDLGRYMAFVIGPMCAINRVSSEPPCHRDCAEYAVQVCPFMCFPQRGRDGANLPANKITPPGFMITRNPGVVLVWVTRTYEVRQAHSGGAGVLLHLGAPVARSWWRHGRPATLAEVMASIETGLPQLREIALTHDGPSGLAELEDSIAETIKSIREDPWPRNAPL